MSSIEIVQSYLNKNFGWKIEIDEKTFDKQIERVCKKLGYDNNSVCIDSLYKSQNSVKTLQILASEFSIGESYFFRDTHFFQQFQQSIIPQILEKDEATLSIWSVGCSRGEELYSIAILLKEIVPEISSWRLHLLGTDVNPDAIEQAKQGLFSEFSFRKMPQEYMKYFTAYDNTYEIDSEIRKMLTFKYHNALEEPYLCLPPNTHGFDIILIKNVLIYFEEEKAKKVVNTLFSIINEGGYLSTTPAEYSMGLFQFPHSKLLENTYTIQKKFQEVTQEPLLTVEDESDMLLQDLYDVEFLNSSQTESIQKVEKLHLNKSLYYHDALKMIEDAEVEKAKLSLQHAIYLDKDLVMAHIVLGNILVKEKKFNSALKHIQNAKTTLQKMQPQQEVELSDGMSASDLLVMINTIKEDNFG